MCQCERQMFPILEQLLSEHLLFRKEYASELRYTAFS
jgi:hypothetical protein